jgi:hypothetical protein
MTKARSSADFAAGGPNVAGKNAIINGGFDVWQRGTSFTTTEYTADRWYAIRTGTVTLTRQTSGAPSGSQYYVRQVSGANASIIDFIQLIETANVVPMQGKTVTLSFKVRRNASLLSDFAYYVQKSATVDAGNGASWTTIVTANIANSLLPTGTTSSDWYSFATSLSIPNDGTANSIRIILEPSSQMPINSSFDLAQVQLELGSTATPFSRAGGTIQGELAACQRYYWRAGGAAYQHYGFGVGATGTISAILINNPTSMRAAPTSVDYSTLALLDGTVLIGSAVPTIVAVYSGPNLTTIDATVASGVTVNRPYRLISNNSTSGFIGFSAEL